MVASWYKWYIRCRWFKRNFWAFRNIRNRWYIRHKQEPHGINGTSSGTSGADGDLFTTTSTTAITIATGAQALNVATGLAYINGQGILITSTSNSSNFHER